MFSKFFIERPIFSSVISIVIVIAGLVTLGGLPIAQYPEITPPTVEVSATYPGANATVVSETVAAPTRKKRRLVIDRVCSPMDSPSLFD